MSKIRILELESFLPTYTIDIEDKIVASIDGEEIEINSFDTDIEEKMYEKKKEELQDESIVDDEDDIVPEWIKQNAKLGAFGEDIALSYLKTLYNNVEKVSFDAKRGYDIEVTLDNDSKLGFEIKTSKSNKGFHITQNELQKASEKQDDYYLFFITVSKKEQKIVGRLIQNPIREFGIDYEMITKHIELLNVFVQPKSFYIQFKTGFFQDLEEISLTKFIG
jgi:hypothetical protein